MWIESHQELGRHPKTKRLALALGVSLPAAIGHLHLLWWWSLDFAQDGILDGYSVTEIADAAMWEGDPVPFVAALVDAGFIDGDEVDRWRLHDWDEYAGKLIERRQRNAERMRRTRAEQAHDTHEARAMHVQSNVTRTCKATVPNLTVPNLTDSEVIQTPDTAAAPTVPKRAPTAIPKYDASGFERIWRVYDRARDRPDAVAWWNREKPDEAWQERMIAAITAQRAACHWGEGNQFQPYLHRWFKAHGWADVIEDRRNERQNGAGHGQVPISRADRERQQLAESEYRGRVLGALREEIIGGAGHHPPAPPLP